MAPRRPPRPRGRRTMKTMGLAVLALALAASAAAQAPAPSPAASPAEWKPGEPPPEMMTYYFVMLVKGPKWTSGPHPELMKLHLAHLRSMWVAQKMVVAGPLLDDGNTRGLCVYKVGSAEEAKALASEDPAVKSGQLAVEVHPWAVQKGILP